MQDLVRRVKRCNRTCPDDLAALMHCDAETGEPQLLVSDVAFAVAQRLDAAALVRSCWPATWDAQKRQWCAQVLHALPPVVAWFGACERCHSMWWRSFGAVPCADSECILISADDSPTACRVLVFEVRHSPTPPPTCSHTCPALVPRTVAHAGLLNASKGRNRTLVAFARVCRCVTTVVLKSGLQQLGKLARAAWHDDTDAYREVVQDGTDVNECAVDDLTPLMLASMCGHGDLCRVLLEHGARVDSADVLRRTALVLAATYGHAGVCCALLERGAQVDDADHLGRTALMFAAQRGHADVCSVLLEHGANVDMVDHSSWTALAHAAYNGRVGVCHVLLEHGAQVDIANQLGTTALMWSAFGGHAELCRMLIERGAQVNAANSDGHTALTWAALYGHLDVCRLLLEHGAPVDAVDVCQTSALRDLLRQHGWRK